MTDKITKEIENINLDDFKNFEAKTDSKLNYKRKTDTISRDFSWLSIVEETIPYLDTIIRNPRKFIQQEDDIVIVEKSKKMSTDTIQHLAQHTNYIQDIDDYGMVKPSKVLNVQKEETCDLYENRFIFTLVKELAKFIRKYTDKDLEPPRIETSNNVSYTAESAYTNENVKISINLETTKNEDPDDYNKELMKTKLENLRNIVADFENSSFIKSLAQAIPVKSPIRKTNVILKDVNFQKALALWEYIKNSEIGDPEEKSTYEEEIKSNDIKKKFNFLYYLDYLAIGSLNSEEEVSSDILLEKVFSLLEEYIDISDISEKKLIELITAEVKSCSKKKREKGKEILKIFKKFIKDHDNYLDGIYNLF